MWREYRRPWKLFSLACGVLILIVGAQTFGAPDWDVPVSFIMAGLTYLTAPWSMRVLIRRQWRHWPMMLFFTWISVDGGYALYWHYRNPAALALMREVNFPASLSLYWLCGLIWLPCVSLREIFQRIWLALQKVLGSCS